MDHVGVSEREREREETKRKKKERGGGKREREGEWERERERGEGKEREKEREGGRERVALFVLHFTTASTNHTSMYTCACTLCPSLTHSSYHSSTHVQHVQTLQDRKHVYDMRPGKPKLLKATWKPHQMTYTILYTHNVHMHIHVSAHRDMYSMIKLVFMIIIIE